MKICVVGEMLARISIKNIGDSFDNNSNLLINYGGAEYNVAANLGYWNNDVTFISFSNDDNLSKCAISHLKSYGVKCDIRNNKNKKPLGLYFYEKNGGKRQGNVIYNRSDSVFANGRFEVSDLEDISDKFDCLYISGTSLGSSSQMADQLIKLSELFSIKNKKIILDINYRSKQWSIEDAKKVIKKIISNVNYLSASLWDMKEILDIKFDNSDDYNDSYFSTSKSCFKTYTKLEYIYSTVKKTVDINVNSIYGVYCYNEQNEIRFNKSNLFLYSNIIDRIGSGDSFSAGFVHTINNLKTKFDYDFPVKANILKHYFNGDNAKLDIELINSISSDIEIKDVKR